MNFFFESQNDGNGESDKDFFILKIPSNFTMPHELGLLDFDVVLGFSFS